MAETTEESPIRWGLTVLDGWSRSLAGDLGTLETETRQWRLESEAHLPSPTASPAPGPPPHWILKGSSGQGAGSAEAPSRSRTQAVPGRVAGVGWAGDGGGYGAGPGGTPREVRAGGANLAAFFP